MKTMASSSRQPKMTAKEYKKRLTEPQNIKKANPINPPVLFSHNSNRFDVPAKLNLDESQRVLLDNLWNCQTQAHKTKSLLALSQYLHSIQQKSLSKNFSHYVVTQSYHWGIFVRWSSVLRAIDGYTWPIYKGFYSMEDASQFSMEKLGPNFYIEENASSSLEYENFVLENQTHEEELKKLTVKNSKLTMQLTAKIFEANDLRMKMGEKQ